ncbi:MAG: hypothetical protein M1814_003725 [Vezdaea aestivalis]|nr:MAG: hypothetical protein M1814_003725 [Vezdaea aestivalis]
MDLTPPRSRASRPPPIVLPRYDSWPLPSHHYSNSLASAAIVNDAYSPFRSASLKGPVRFNPKGRRNKSVRACLSFCRLQARRIIYGRITWLVIFVLLAGFYLRGRGREDFEHAKIKSEQFGKDMVNLAITKDLQLIPASNPKFYYVGRWTASPNRLRMDGTFPGVYFDIVINGTTSLYLSIRNAAPRKEQTMKTRLASAATAAVGHMSFHPVDDKHKAAAPISLLALIDHNEYVLLPDSQTLVPIRIKDLDPKTSHDVRVIAPMTGGPGGTILEFEGIWVDKPGKLLRVEGSQLEEYVDGEDDRGAENEVGIPHETELAKMTESGRLQSESKQTSDALDSENQRDRIGTERRKVLEVVTDIPGSLVHQNKTGRTGGSQGLLAGVMGWEYLLGEMFGVDHVTIGVDGMCLVQDCVGGTGNPAGMSDVFFRSGPIKTEYFPHAWLFNGYVPDVLILNLGSSDFDSFEHHQSDYNQSAWDMFKQFENSYFNFVRAIRKQAYPNHPAIIEAQKTGSTAGLSNYVPPVIPIFVMRPLKGQYEHATQGAVRRLREEGDKHVFWLDTSDWLDTDETWGEQEFWFDEGAVPSRWRLTERGNQRVAIFLHMHVCRYLAKDNEKCAFLPPEVYQGKVFNPESAEFDKYIENEKERKLKNLFLEENP